MTPATAKLLNPVATVAVLSRVSIGEWRAECDDRMQAANLADRAGADRRAVRVRKARVLHPTITKLSQTVAAFRNEHYRLTLPWLDRGVRLLPIQLIPTYQLAEQKARAEFERLADELAAQWPRIIATMPDVLGGLYKEDDYPTAGAVRAAYTWTARLLAVPDMPPYAGLIPESVLAEIEASIKQEAAEGVAGAMRDVYERLAETIGRMAETLAGEGNRWHGTTVTNVRELLDIADALNVTGDATLSRIVEAARVNLTQYSAEYLKEDDETRALVARKAAAVAGAAQAALSGAADPLAKLAGVLALS